MNLLLEKLSFRKLLAFAIAALAAFAFCILLAIVMPAQAQTNTGTLTYEDKTTGQKVVEEFTDITSLLNKANKAGVDVTISLNDDWYTDSRIYIPNGRDYTFELNGHMIDRGLASKSSDWYASSYGEVFYMGKAASLTIYGGDTTTQHKGTLEDKDCFWKSDPLRGTTVINGGLITGGATDSASGAGICCEYAKSKVYLYNVTIAGNISDENSGSNGSGGGIGMSPVRDTADRILNSTLYLNNTKVKYNHAESNGGGIYLGDAEGTTLLIDQNSEVSNNYADGGLGGAGIFVSATSGNISINIHGGSKVSNNRTPEDGGGIYYYGNDAKIWIDGKSSISGNIAGSGDGGGICTASPNIIKAEKVYVEVSNGSSISGNTALNGDGGGIYYDNRAGSVSVLSGSKISSNKAQNGAGIYNNYNDSTITVDGSSTISYNEASENGGGLYLNDVTTLKVSDNSDISYNKAVDGAGVYNDDDTSAIELSGKSSIYSNTATGNGGGIYSTDDLKIEVTDSTECLIHSNKAKNGAGLWFENGMTLIGTTFTNNILSDTSGNGAGVYCDNESYHEFIIKGKITITGNYADENKTVRSNLALRYDEDDQQQINGDRSGENLVSADSRIGITVVGYTGKTTRISGNPACCANFKDKLNEVIYSDDDRYGITNTKVGCDYNYAWLYNEPSGYIVEVWNGNTGKEFTRFVRNQGSNQTLSSSKYSMSGTVKGKTTEYKLNYWTIKTAEGTYKLYPQNDEATFKMPASRAIATAHYTPALSGVEVNVKDSSADWTDLSEVANATVGSATLTDAAGKDLDFDEEECSDAVIVQDVQTDQISAKQKKITYTISMTPWLAEDNGMYVFDDEGILTNALEAGTDAGPIKFCGLTVSTSFGNYTADDAEVWIADKTIYVKGSVLINDPAASYTVKFNSKGGSTVDDQVIRYGSKATKPADPTRDGYTFEGWMLDGKAFDFETAITGDITLVASWKSNTTPVDPDNDGSKNNSDSNDKGSGSKHKISYVDNNTPNTSDSMPYALGGFAGAAALAGIAAAIAKRRERKLRKE